MKPLSIKLLPTLTLLFSSLLLLNGATAKGLNGPHTHGELEMTMQFTNNKLIMEMVVPAQDIVGFEDAPTTAAKKNKVKTADKSLYELKNLAVLFNFSPEHSCLPYESYINADVLNYHSHPEGDSLVQKLAKDQKAGEAAQADDVHTVGVKGHSDFVMTYEFDCDNVQSISLHFSDQFPTLRKINLRDKNLNGRILQSFNANQNDIPIK
ncbi:MAG: DUF2796 domain-containing protein [Cocleimonas sp.]|nr:DUF2796 domain-containing protein [Cocleimonas sp.]